jgi:hypothetical protein
MTTPAAIRQLCPLFRKSPGTARVPRASLIKIRAPARETRALPGFPFPIPSSCVIGCASAHEGLFRTADFRSDGPSGGPENFRKGNNFNRLSNFFMIPSTAKGSAPLQAPESAPALPSATITCCNEYFWMRASTCAYRIEPADVQGEPTRFLRMIGHFHVPRIGCQDQIPR